MRNFRTVFQFFRSSPKYAIAAGVVVLLVGFAVWRVATRTNEQVATVASVSHVTVSSVASLVSQNGPLPVVGIVSSLNKAVVLAQSSGQIVTLNKKLGDYVSAGEVVAAFDNASQRAALLQAQGAYDAAQANLAKTGSTAANTSLSSTLAQKNAATARAAAVAAVQSAYAVLDDAVHTKADVLFNNSGTVSPTFILLTSNSQLDTNIQNQRSKLEGVLANAKSLQEASTADVDASISTMLSNAQTVLTFVSDTAQAINEAVPNQDISAATIAGYQATMSLARSAVVQTIASLNAAKGAYDSAQSAAQTTSNTATTGTSNDTAVAQANVKQALGALDSARALVEKTIIRSPISGTIVSLPITEGGYISAPSPVVQISNPRALEVVTNVTPEDAKTLAVGGKATIGADTKGVITSIAPAIDPTTNKIQVKVGLVGDQSNITDNQTVTVELDRVTQRPKGTKSAAITIPIVSTKITPQGPVVFTVSSSTLLARPVQLGAILGDRVTITSGLTPEMDIVTDARGLSTGQTVVVETK